MMFNALPALVLALLPLAFAQDNDTTAVLQDLMNAKIVPNVVPQFTPLYPLDVVFTDDTGSKFPVTAGSNLTSNQTANLPSFALKSTDSQITGKPYLLAIIDPDAPDPQDPSLAQFRHFLAADYSSSGPTNGQFVLANHSTNETLTDYLKPGPQESSPPHRYVVLCYLQTSLGVTPPDGFHPFQRAHFNITEFVTSVPGNNFTLVAATFFYVSANDTIGSVVPNSTTGNPPAAQAAAASASSKPNGATSLSAAAGWSAVAVLGAASALLL